MYDEEDDLAWLKAMAKEYGQIESEDDDDSYSVTEFMHILNEELEYSYENTRVKGEVSGYKESQGKWVFFDLKDEQSSMGCFLPIWELRVPLEDGMKVLMSVTPKLTKWGKFSLTVHQITPIGEGSIKKGFDLLKQKLLKEGLFDPARKREIPEDLAKIGVISSTQAAGYADFCKILNARWGGIEVLTAHTQVQGLEAPDQIIRALRYFNEQTDVQAVAIIRGGGSADDLAAFNDEKLVREIAASRVPVITGIGHEIDESLADLAADLAASTPSNVAELITPDKQAEAEMVRSDVRGAYQRIMQELESQQEALKTNIAEIRRGVDLKIESFASDLKHRIKTIEGLNPERVLAQGYALFTGKAEVGQIAKITTAAHEMEAKITKVKERSKNG